MPLIVNTVEMEEVIVDGVPMDEVLVDGVLVFTAFRGNILTVETFPNAIGFSDGLYGELVPRSVPDFDGLVITLGVNTLVITTANMFFDSPHGALTARIIYDGGVLNFEAITAESFQTFDPLEVGPWQAFLNANIGNDVVLDIVKLT